MKNRRCYIVKESDLISFCKDNYVSAVEQLVDTMLYVCYVEE